MLGIMKGSTDGDSQLMIQDEFQSAEEAEELAKRLSIQSKQRQAQATQNANLKIFNLDDEEDRDKDGVRILLTKYSKIFKFLFHKYAYCGTQTSKLESFEQISDKSIGISEICKFLADHDLLVSLASSAILTQIVATT